MLAWLGRETGMRAIAGTTLRRHDGYYGNGLLTRCEVKAVELVDLSFPKREPRGAIAADLQLDGTGSLRVVATHLGLRPAERREQVERLLQLFTWHEHDRSVLLGDLNEWFLWGRPLRHLHKYFDETPAVPTFPSRHAGLRARSALDAPRLDPARAQGPQQRARQGGVGSSAAGGHVGSLKNRCGLYSDLRNLRLT